MDELYVKAMGKKRTWEEQYISWTPMFCDVGLVLCRKTKDDMLLPIPKFNEADLLAGTGVTRKTLFARAFKMTRIKYPFDSVITGRGIDKMFLVTSCQRINGAIYAFTDKAVNTAARALGTNQMYVSFLSENEAVFQRTELTADIIKKTLIDMVRNPPLGDFLNTPLSIHPMLIQKRGESKWMRKTVKTADTGMLVAQ